MKRAALEKAVEAPAVPEVVSIRFERIVKLHNEVDQLKDEAFACVKMTVEKVIMIGGLLTEEKASLEHGAWLPWISNLPFCQKTVSNYMRCFQDKAKLVNATNLKAAYLLLEAPGKGRQAEKKPKDGTREPESETHTEEPPPDEQEKAEAAPAQATGGQEVKSGPRPGVTAEDIESEPSAKDELVLMLRDVKRDVERILLDCDGFTEAYGEIDGSIFKQFTDEEQSEAKELIRFFGMLQNTMETIKQSLGEKGKREGFFRSRIGGGSRNRKAQ